MNHEPDGTPFEDETTNDSKAVLVEKEKSSEDILKEIRHAKDTSILPNYE
jgi:hypothetical protein